MWTDNTGCRKKGAEHCFLKGNTPSTHLPQFHNKYLEYPFITGDSKPMFPSINGVLINTKYIAESLLANPPTFPKLPY